MSALAAVVTFASPDAPRAGGTIVGVVTTSARGLPPIRVTVDPKVCGQSVPDESVVTDASGHVAGAVITVAGVKASAPPDASVVYSKATNPAAGTVSRTALPLRGSTSTTVPI